ncbi:hypothetical protein VCV18_000556 [Metarhizium anisopliae]
MAEATWRKEMRGGVEYEEHQLENSWPPDAGAWHEYEFSLIHSFIHSSSLPPASTPAVSQSVVNAWKLTDQGSRANGVAQATVSSWANMLQV